MAKKIITLVDYGRAEYLDGARMQFCVCEDAYPSGQMLAYFENKEDAELFAKARARRDGRKFVTEIRP